MVDYSAADSLRPAEHAATVTPSDSTDLAFPALSLWVGGTGNVSAVTVGGETVTFSDVSGILPVQVKRVLATSTTATGIIAIW